jgi:hypothetical protein
VHVFTPSFSSTLKLKDLAKVGVGLVSGLERAFYVSEEELESLKEGYQLYVPNIYRKLLAFKERLQSRYLPKGKSWFHWRALRN